MGKSKKARRLDEVAAQSRVCTRRPLHESRTRAVPGDGKDAARVRVLRHSAVCLPFALCVLVK
jgi:uracil-DNA glycosylase